MYRVAFIGAGVVVRRHLEAAHAHADTAVCAVADLSAERAQQQAADFGAAVYTDYLEMLDREKPEAAVISLPHALHEEAAVACARRGIHMLLEKPMSVSYASCGRINQACRENGVLLQVGHPQSFFPENRAAREIIASGELGELMLISEMRITNYFATKKPWLLKKEIAGGGTWINFGAHSLDKLCYLTDSRIESVTGQCTYKPPVGDVEGSAQVVARTVSGVTESITLCGYPDTVPHHETLLYFTHGSLRLVTGEGLWISRARAYEPVSLEGRPETFALQWAEFVRGLQEGKIRCCDGEYAAEIIRHIESVWTADAAAGRAACVLSGNVQ